MLSAVVIVVVAFMFARICASEVFVYPAKSQSEAKMNKDKAECKAWAQKQSGVDPANPAASIPNEPQKQSGPQGERIAGGARGAAGGAAAGAVIGDAAKGAAVGGVAGAIHAGVKHRQGKKNEKNNEMKMQMQQQEIQLEKFNRAYIACLEGRGYTAE